MAYDPTYSGNQPQGLEAAASTPDPVEFTTQINQPSGIGVTINEDGSIEIGAPATQTELSDDKFDENLAERVDIGALNSIAEEVIEGVTSDLASRAGFMENYNKGLELLGLKIEDATTSRSQKRNVSRVSHPLLLEAVIRFQALARNELLPAIGPCKVQTIGGSTAEEDDLASGLESDMNYFLTSVDKGYYPDFDRALFSLGFGGNIFKKVYHDPLKRYPVSRSIQIEDLIVSEDASDLHNAQRVTHRIFIGDGTLKKLQHAGEYIDCTISAGMPTDDSTKLKQGTIVGVTFQGGRTQDLEHELYETYMDLDLSEHGLREKGSPSEIPLPYVITIDRATRTVLALRRNWKKGDKQFSQRRRIVHYGLIPSFGFLCLGYLHLLGNQTRALRAIWRILIDSGMFSSFPGGMKAKGMRTNTNEIAPSPGEFVEVDIGPFDKLQDGFMMMPYKEPSAIFIQLSEMIGKDSQRMGGTAEMSGEEGRTHIPVGTMMAMIEQATQTMSSVHKRIHSAMQEELSLLKELFAEDPDALTRLTRSPARQKYVADEFNDVNLVPATDPNIPSQTHRIQQAVALVTLAKDNPGLYDVAAVNKRALKAIGINDWASVMHEQPTPPAPDPEVAVKLEESKIKQQSLAQAAKDSERKAASEATQSINTQKAQELESHTSIAELKLKESIALEKEKTARLRIQADQQQSKIDQQQAHREFAGSFASEKMKQQTELMKEAHTTQREHTSEHIKGAYGLAAAALKPKPAPAGGKSKPKKKK